MVQESGLQHGEFVIFSYWHVLLGDIAPVPSSVCKMSPFCTRVRKGDTYGPSNPTARFDWGDYCVWKDNLDAGGGLIDALPIR